MPRISLAPPIRTQTKRSPREQTPGLAEASDRRCRHWNSEKRYGFPLSPELPPLTAYEYPPHGETRISWAEVYCQPRPMSSRFRVNVKPIPGRLTLALCGQETFCALRFDGKCSRGNELMSPSNRRSPQKVNFNPSCITRLLPEPTSGLPAATSGVAHPQPTVAGVPMSLVPPDAPP